MKYAVEATYLTFSYGPEKEYRYVLNSFNEYDLAKQFIQRLEDDPWTNDNLKWSLYELHAIEIGNKTQKYFPSKV